MTAEATSSRPAAGTRPRPAIHFTADDGWINDPYGVTWVDGEYHLYYQAIPGRVTWGPNCHWGHATSPDLLRWTHQPLALIPQDFEVGCWSGSVVHDAEPPLLFYTRVAGENWEIGQVATAVFDRRTGTWATNPAAVIDAPPADLGVRGFRDPNVFRHGDGWSMLMAAALADGSAAVLQYRSRDLHQWAFDGVLCSRPNDPADEVPTGALWECPQLFPLGDRWVLLVSVWDHGDLLYVAAATGDYDGRRFAPATWQRLTHGASAYATTAFLDHEGRRCVLSWLREEPRDNAALTVRAGAHSVVSTLRLRADGTLVLEPHPNVDALRGPFLTGSEGQYRVGAHPAEVTGTPTVGEWCRIAEEDRTRARLSFEPDGDRDAGLLRIDRPGFPTDVLPVGDARAGLRVLLDADIVEIFAADSYGAYRIAAAGDPSATTVLISGDAAVCPLR
ncbi:glycoside hydrolase family 32 protein [Acrocarpospora sp. B8E8]|uniref:glycoside hydrolase family 32 protein n=1 Tax=Acrocarpospora sp. B8E8 TaxID=3153572 RepID=UPI00325CC555